MLSIAIDRVHARYRLPPAALREQARLKRIVDAAFERTLETALEEHGIGRESYVCIRDVHAVVNMRLRDPDAALTRGVGEAIARAVRQLIDERSALVVEYPSRVHALIDVASSAPAGDFSRSWAWAQVGVWTADFPLRADLTADLIVRSLAKEPTCAVAVAAHLARARTDRFHALITRATPKSWSALAHAAIAAARGGADLPISSPVAIAKTNALELVDDSRVVQALASIARRAVSRSAIAHASIEQWTRASAETRRALSMLVLLESEPSAARHDDAPRLVTTIEQLMALSATAIPAIPTAPDGERDSRDRVATRENAAPQGRTVQTPGDTEAAESPGADARQRARTPIDADGTTGPMANEHGSPARESADDALRAGEMLPDVRATVSTRHGGLLYIVNVLTRIDLVEAIVTDTRWSSRGLRWVLHQLAMSLAAIEADDPAALAFAGLVPGSLSPAAQQEPPTESERNALDTLRGTVVAALGALLNQRGDDESASVERVLQDVCARPARIVADPGWIEVHFSADEVSLDIRRTGLDRDPDWVPWLGIVLRFVYA